MILYYEGITKNGEKITGTFNGTKEELASYLRKQSIFLTQVKEQKKKLKKGKYKLNQFASDIEQIAYFVGSGMQIDKALHTLIKNTSKQASIEFWENVLQGLKSGKQFSVALKESAKKIKLPLGDLYINIISVGEEIGDLKSALKKVSEYLEFKGNLIKEVRSAMAYPIFLVIVSILAIFFISVFILPRFSSIFTQKDMHVLPFISRFVIETGKFIRDNLNLVIGGLLSFVAGVVALFSLEETRKIIKSSMYKIPGANKVMFQLEFANMCSSLGTMLEGGVEIGRALRLTERVVDNPNLKNILADTVSEIKKGFRISDVWKRYNIIPEDIVSLVVVGENSAKLGEIFVKLGERYALDFRQSVSKMLTLLEPVMIIFLGLVVGIIVVAIMLAVVSLNNVAG